MFTLPWAGVAGPLTPEEELLRDQYVRPHFYAASLQHPAREWEYTLVIATLLKAWEKNDRANRLLDVGGAGSPLPYMIAAVAPSTSIRVLDPKVTEADRCGGIAQPHRNTLDQYVDQWGTLHDAVVAVSVIEHVPDELAFLWHLWSLVRPGGVLILTMDATIREEAGGDLYHFHWMRERIYTVARLMMLQRNLERWEGRVAAGVEIPDLPLLVHDYTFAGLVVRKPFQFATVLVG